MVEVLKEGFQEKSSKSLRIEKRESRGATGNIFIPKSKSFAYHQSLHRIRYFQHANFVMTIHLQFLNT